MFQIFQSRLRFTKGVYKPAQSDYIRRNYDIRLKTMKEYYRSRAIYMRNDHILVRLITICFGSMRTDYRTFVDTASAMVDSNVRFFQFTNAASYGKIWQGVFYGKGSHEIILSDDTDFDIDDAVTNWKDLEAVKVLTHCVSDFSLVLPNGSNSRDLNGLAVISINIPMLMLQFRRFVEDTRRTAALNGLEPIVTPKLFLYRYVLPNMMSSHLDHVVMNRIINLYMHLPMTECKVKSAFMQAEAGNSDLGGLVMSVNRSLRDCIDKILKSPMDYEQMFMNIFCIDKEDALELLTVPDIAPTRQVWWAMLLTRLKHCRFAVEISRELGNNKNTNFDNKLIMDFTRILDTHVLDRVLEPPLLRSTIEQIQELISLAEK